jgi:hypothetical protein
VGWDLELWEGVGSWILAFKLKVLSQAPPPNLKIRCTFQKDPHNKRIKEIIAYLE